MFLVATKGYGFSIDEIKWSCPNDLEPYLNAYKLENKKRDEEMWLQGRYNLSAFETVMAHFGAGLAGKKSNAQYIEKPLMQMAEEKHHMENLTKEEKKKYTEQLFIRLRVMQSNFELSSKSKDGMGS